MTLAEASVAPVPGQAPDRASGFVTTQFVLAVALSLVLFVMLCNAIVYQYGRGVVRAALDEGVRSASRAGGTVGGCEAAAEEVRHSLLGGPVGGHVTIHCGLVADTVHATATGYLPSWLPLVPDWPIDLAASAVKEPFSAPPTSTPASAPAMSPPGASPPRGSALGAWPSALVVALAPVALAPAALAPRPWRAGPWRSGVLAGTAATVGAGA